MPGAPWRVSTSPPFESALDQRCQLDVASTLKTAGCHTDLARLPAGIVDLDKLEAFISSTHSELTDLGDDIMPNLPVDTAVQTPLPRQRAA